VISLTRIRPCSGFSFNFIFEGNIKKIMCFGLLSCVEIVRALSIVMSVVFSVHSTVLESSHIEKRWYCLSFTLSTRALVCCTAMSRARSNTVQSQRDGGHAEFREEEERACINSATGGLGAARCEHAMQGRR
jgi:hypothetical protein